mmetsp:Transcript_22498/g.32923  ORF Transcript_22498/g.32923 Transcript_22498/m.32923 type:complete len:242 (+) Transcript_22498:30-755(+)
MLKSTVQIMMWFGFEPSFPVLIISRFFQPLQGLFNILIYTRPHVKAVRDNDESLSWFRALLHVVNSGGDRGRIRNSNQQKNGNGSNTSAGSANTKTGLRAWDGFSNRRKSRRDLDLQLPAMLVTEANDQPSDHQGSRRHSTMSLAVMSAEERHAILADRRHSIDLATERRPRRYSAMAMAVMSQEQRDAIMAASKLNESIEDILPTQQNPLLPHNNQEPSICSLLASEEEDKEANIINNEP